ncbi:hypothetical protein J6590_091768 [Homalodisca vitripennis]|nr:hypothetical protein J6590_091768 [Homalodisca vitripennis]
MSHVFSQFMHLAPGTIRSVNVERRAALDRHQSGEGGHDTSGASVLQYAFDRVVWGGKREIKRWGVHPINRERMVYGEYHHLIKQLEEDPERFFPVHSDELKTVRRSMTHLSVKRRTKSNRAGFRSPLKSIVTSLFTFARQHMGPDCESGGSTLTARIVPEAFILNETLNNLRTEDSNLPGQVPLLKNYVQIYINVM